MIKRLAGHGVLAGSTIVACTLSVPQALFSIQVANGTPSPPGVYSHVPRIWFGQSKCSAVLVSDRVALTARHCLPMNDAGHLALNARVNVESPRDWDYATSAVPCAVHPQLDVAFVRLADAPTRRGSSFGRLPAGMLFPPTTKITGVGWGETTPGAAPGSFPRQAPTYGDAIVNSHSDTEFVVNGGQTACHGDSGGPGFVQGSDTIAGINVRFDEVVVCGQAARYIRLDTPSVRLWAHAGLNACANVH